MKPGLGRIQEACIELGHPENKFSSIHVAGTNGKGSVCAMLQSVLSESGLKVGLFTSPHLVKVNERFKIGDREISDADLEKYLQKIGDKNALSFFEKCSLIAFLYFADQKVDFAILETGLGGRLDATNVVRPLVSVITEIDLDHTETLGNSLASIAEEKAGIIKESVPVICAASHEEAKQVIEKVAQEKNAPFFNVQREQKSSFPYVLNLQGEHQIQNAKIVLAVLSNFFPGIDSATIQNGFTKTSWPGRLHWFSREPAILLDGAHNVAAMLALVKYLKKSQLKWKVLFSAASDKKVGEMLKILQEASSEIILCRMKNSRSIDPVEIQKKFASELHCKLLAAENTEIEFKKQKALLQKGEGLLMTGSLYFIAELLTLEQLL